MFRYRLYVTSFLIFWSNSIVYAADVHFEINAGACYESNVFRSSTDPKEDTCFMLAPEIALRLPLNRFRLHLDSSSRLALEQHVSQTNANLQELVFSGFGRYSISTHASFGLRDRLIVSKRLKSADELSDMLKWRNFTDNGVVSDLRYELKPGALVASVEYSNTTRDYKNTERDDWLAHTGRLQIEYFLGRKTSAQLAAGLTRKVYEADVDYISAPVILLLKRKLGSKTEASCSLGSESRRYNEAHQDRNWDEPIAALEVTGNLTPKTSLRLLLRRKVYDSDMATGYAFANTAAGISIAFNLSYSTQLVFRGAYARNGYIEFQRMDYLFVGYGAVRYNFVERGSLVFSYRHERRTSSISAYDYQQHILDLSYTVVL